MITDYKSLKDACESWLARSTLTDQLPHFVQLAEARIAYGSGEPGFESEPIRIRSMEKTSTVSIADGVGTLPSDFLEAIRVRTSGDPVKPIPLIGRQLLFDRTWPSTGHDVAAIDGLSLVLGSGAASANVALTYFSRPAPLALDTDTTSLLSECPALYLSATLAEAFHFVRNIEEAQLWLQKFRGAAVALTRSDQGSRTSGWDWKTSPDVSLAY